VTTSSEGRCPEAQKYLNQELKKYAETAKYKNCEVLHRRGLVPVPNGRRQVPSHRRAASGRTSASAVVLGRQPTYFGQRPYFGEVVLSVSCRTSTIEAIGDSPRTSAPAAGLR
jgi:hypothetical protein